jgi:hypothetical protein
MQTDLPAAFDWSCQLTNVDSRQRALEKIIPALAADDFTNALVRLNDLQPAPEERIYQLLFQRWAAQDPAQAIEHRQQLPDQDQGDRMLNIILTVWVEQQPEAALIWVQSQPDSPFKTKALEICLAELAKMDLPQALEWSPKTLQPQTTLWPWTKWLANSSYLGRPTIIIVESEMLSNITNGQTPISPPK